MDQIVVSYDPGTGQVQIRGNVQRDIPISEFQKYTLDGNYNDQLTNPQFIRFQQTMRVLDMMKDGKTHTPTVPQDRICGYIGHPPNQCPEYARLTTIKDGIRQRNIDNITTTTWLTPNERSSKLIKLPQSNTYKESGIDPDAVIWNPLYQSNIATEIIDPLGRTYPNPDTVRRFPDVNTRLVLESSFLTLFGFNDCALMGRRTSNTNHDYQITLGPNYTINGPSDRRPDGWNWFAGNKTKNQYIVNNEGDRATNRALLNIKEMGDVLQVLIMFITKQIDPPNNIPHTMVTGDEVVFSLCLQLGLDCVLYHHQPSAEHSVRSFRAGGPLDVARYEWQHRKTTILEHNRDIIAAIETIRNRESIQIKTMTVRNRFNFCAEFYDHLLQDMGRINDSLNGLRIDAIVPANGMMSDTEQIAIIKHHIETMKRQYTLLKLFTKATNGTITFNPSPKTYTTEDPIGLGFTLDGYNRRTPFLMIYKNYYQMPKRLGCRSLSGGSRPGKKQRGGDNEDDIFMLSFQPIQYIDRSEHYNPEYPNNATNRSDPNELNIMIPKELHAEWAYRVMDYFGRLCMDNHALYKLFRDDLFWELYHESYLHNVVIDEDQLEERIDIFYNNCNRYWNNLERQKDGPPVYGPVRTTKKKKDLPYSRPAVSSKKPYVEPVVLGGRRRTLKKRKRHIRTRRIRHHRR